MPGATEEYVSVVSYPSHPPFLHSILPPILPYSRSLNQSLRHPAASPNVSGPNCIPAQKFLNKPVSSVYHRANYNLTGLIKCQGKRQRWQLTPDAEGDAGLHSRSAPPTAPPAVSSLRSVPSPKEWKPPCTFSKELSVEPVLSSPQTVHVFALSQLFVMVTEL